MLVDCMHTCLVQKTKSQLIFHCFLFYVVLVVYVPLLIYVLAIHLNFLQEAAQPEGDLRARGCFEALKIFANELPVIAKETGAGISRHVARSLARTRGGAPGTVLTI